MKQKHNEGFSLVEVLVAIVILGIFVVPTCSSLVLSLQMSSKADQMLKAQLAVSSALEEMKAEGVSGTDKSYENESVKVTVSEVTGEPYFEVTAQSKTVDSVKVTTYIREVPPTTEGGEAG